MDVNLKKLENWKKSEKKMEKKWKKNGKKNGKLENLTYNYTHYLPPLTNNFSWWGCHSIELTSSVWPLKVITSSFIFLKSNNRIIVSLHPVINQFPFLLNFSLFIHKINVCVLCLVFMLLVFMFVVYVVYGVYAVYVVYVVYVCCVFSYNPISIFIKF